MFTVDPHAPQSNTMMINALWGLGKYAVEGAVTPDLYVVAKQDGLRLVEEKIAHKPRGSHGLARRGLSGTDFSTGTGGRSLSEPGADTDSWPKSAWPWKSILAAPQDVEWAEDQEGAIVILQSRPLRLESLVAPAPNADTTAAPLTPEILPLLEGGQRAVGGVAAGPVYWLHSDREIDKVPEGAVVALRHPSTRLVLVMDRLNAIITEIGSPTDHMTILAREFRVPTIVGAGPAIQTLQNEQLVTLDADHSQVFSGIVVELLQHRYDKGESWQETMVFQKYRQIIKKVVPLHLLEPESPDFQADNCRTLHDITRFCHEKAMDAMFNPNVEEMVSAPGVARLQADLPFNLFIVDLGGGLAVASKVITEKDIRSRPLQAMLRGFHHPNVRSGQVAPDLKGFISVFANTMYDQGKAEGGLGGKSFAIVSDTYLNFSSRLGYHFGLVDAYAAPDINDNYLSFQFKGGAASIDRRERRARMLQVILEDMGFKVTVKQDLVQGRLVKFSQDEIDTILESLAVLMAFCRQLDMAFTSDAVMETYLEAFRNKDYNLESAKTVQ